MRIKFRLKPLQKNSECVPLHQQTRKLSDFISPYGASIPMVLINLLAEIERRGLKEQGIYRIPGDEKKVKTLMNKILDTPGPLKLFDVDVHILCGVVKEFLRSFEKPLFPLKWIESSFPETKDQILIKVQELPDENRETLALLMLHLEKVQRSKETMMTATNLSIVMAMTIFGESTENILEKVMADNKKKRFVFEEMMKIGDPTWKLLLIQKTGVSA